MGSFFLCGSGLLVLGGGFVAVVECGRIGFGLVELFWLGDFGLLGDIILSLCTVFTGV